MTPAARPTLCAKGAVLDFMIIPETFWAERVFNAMIPSVIRVHGRELFAAVNPMFLVFTQGTFFRFTFSFLVLSWLSRLFPDFRETFVIIVFFLSRLFL